MNWKRSKTTGVIPVSLRKHSATVVGCKIFVFGGSYDGLLEELMITNPLESNQPISELYIYDTQTNSWSKPKVSGDIPPPIMSHSATLVGEKIYVFGGGYTKQKEQDDNNASNNNASSSKQNKTTKQINNTLYYSDIYELDTVTLNWKRIEIKDGEAQPSPRRAHSATAVDSKIYIFGGGSGPNALNELWCFCTEKLQWKEINSKGTPFGRGYHSATKFGKKIYIFGGSDTKDCFSDLAILDTSNHSWSRKKVPYRKNVQRYSHTTTLVGNWLFIISGCNGKEYINDTCCLDLKTMKWKNIFISGNLPQPRGYHTASLLDNRIFLLGGSNHKQVFDSLHILDLGCYSFLCCNSK